MGNQRRGDIITPIYPPASWRLLHTGHADGATNMAVDEAILLAVAQGQARPTIRFFGWQPPCLSIGYAQPMAGDVEVARCAAHGVDCVRRPTGGRAILHTGELTYSLIAPATDPRITSDVLETYRRLSAGLVLGLRRLGVAVDQSPGKAAAERENSPACFDVPSRYEITFAGRKLVGSAQTRRRGAVLQHGSLPLAGDVARICDYLRLPSEADRAALRRELRARAISLEEALGHTVSFEQAAQALAEGFAQALNLQLIPGQLTTAEQASAKQLRQEKYGNREWNFRR